MKTMECSLREKKHARTKIAIMNSFIERLRRTRFDDISIKQVCAEVEVAEGTFFNYFPEKIDVIRYYLFLHIVKTIWKAKKQTSAGKCLPLIEAVFKQLSEEWSNDNLMYQITAVLLSQGDKPKSMEISAIEKSLAFPDCPGIEDVPSVMLYEWFKECMIQAQKNNELPAKINLDDTVISLMTIIAGTTLATRFSDRNDKSYHYIRQLRALWRDLGVKGY